MDFCMPRVHADISHLPMRVLIGVPTSAGEASEGEVEVCRAGAVHAQKLAHGPDISHTRICLNIF